MSEDTKGCDKKGSDANAAGAARKTVYPVAGTEISIMGQVVAANDDDGTVERGGDRVWNAGRTHRQPALAVAFLADDLFAVVHRLF